MKLRDYQQRAVDAVLSSLSEQASTLIVLPTGCGKTVCFAHVADHFKPLGRVMVLAHREELINQAAEKIAAVTGHAPDIEMGERWADQPNMHGYRAPFIVSSIQTQIAGRGGRGRMTRFSPHDFSLVIIDEAHRSTAASYRKVIEHYRQNPDLKVLGVTATPDRADEAALGQVFDSVAFDYEINDAIDDGWLAPITQRSVTVEGLDFSHIKTTKGDLDATELAQVLETESNMQGVAGPTYELAAGRQTLMFAHSLAQAELLCNILNRYRDGCARFVHGKTDDVTRKQALTEFRDREFQFLVNVGIYTEGFDEPSIQVVALARPTKSRSLFAQMVGRGTRPLPGIVDGLPDAAARRAAIAASDKPAIEVLDFAGNAGRHKLVTCADILGGKYSEAVISLATEKAKASDEPVDMRRMLELAEEELEKRREESERKRQAEAARRAGLLAKVAYSTEVVNAFDILDIRPVHEKGWDKSKPASEKQIDFLRRHGIDNASQLSSKHAGQLIGEMMSRWNQEKCSFKQARVLKKHGYPTDVSKPEAKRLIDALAANNWRRPVDTAALVGATEGEL